MLNTKLQKLMVTESQSKADFARFVLLGISIFSMPFDFFFTSLSFICFCLVTLLSINKARLTALPKHFWMFQMVFFLSVIGYFYSLHKSTAGFLLERQLSLFLAPLFVPLGIPINARNVRRLIWIFVSACIAANLFLIFYLIYKIIFLFQLPLFQTIFKGVFFNHEFSKPLGIHAGYLSLYFAFAIVFLANEAVNCEKAKMKIFIFLGVAFLLLGLFFLASRNTIISLALIFLFVFPLWLVKNKRRYFAISVSLVMLMVFAVVKVPYLKNRFSTELLLDIKARDGVKMYSVSVLEPRVERWKGAVELIKKSAVYGYGTGDEVSALKTEYAKRFLYISSLEDFNAHNTYLSILIKHGFLGLTVFVACFFYYLRLAFLSRSFVYGAFLILFLFGFYTENLLDANKGIVLFAYMNVLLGMLAINSSNHQVTARIQSHPSKL